MATDWTSKQGDAAPVLSDTLTYSDGSPVDLTGATLSFVARALAGASPLKLTGTTTSPLPGSGTIQFSPTAADTATAGLYMTTWVVVLADGAQMTFPTVGYNSWSIEENLSTAGGQQLVGLPDVKRKCKITANSRAIDEELVGLIHAVRPIVEHITGPIIPQTFDEWHDGGHSYIMLRHPPRTSYGTSPVLNLMACSEYNGPIEWPLAIVPSPDKGQLYSCMLDLRMGRVVRRTAGGGEQAFPAGIDRVHVVYQAGQATVPENVREGTLELIRVNYQSTQATGRGSLTQADAEDLGMPSLGFFIPRRVRELLSPTKRYPGLA